MRLVLNRDALSGILFALFGIGGLWFGRVYMVGTSSRMGPGYFPLAISVLLVALGVLLFLRGQITGRKEEIGWNFVPTLLIAGALVLFMFMIERAGLILAVVAMVFVACWAGHERNWRDIALLAVGLALGSYALFVLLLGVPLRAFWD